MRVAQGSVTILASGAEASSGAKTAPDVKTNRRCAESADLPRGVASWLLQESWPSARSTYWEPKRRRREASGAERDLADRTTTIRAQYVGTRRPDLSRARQRLSDGLPGALCALSVPDPARSPRFGDVTQFMSNATSRPGVEQPGTTGGRESYVTASFEDIKRARIVITNYHDFKRREWIELSASGCSVHGMTGGVIDASRMWGGCVCRPARMAPSEAAAQLASVVPFAHIHQFEP
jgi:hypothetical protein